MNIKRRNQGMREELPPTPLLTPLLYFMLGLPFDERLHQNLAGILVELVTVCAWWWHQRQGAHTQAGVSTDGHATHSPYTPHLLVRHIPAPVRASVINLWSDSEK